MTLLWIRLARALRFPLLVTTHYGYAAWTELWEDSYRSLYGKALHWAPALLLLSPEIETAFREKGYRGWSGVLPNGVDTARMSWSDRGNGRAICLGRIEPRKRQAILVRALKEATVACDFVGPMEDPAFADDGLITRYLGSWSRERVYQSLTEYSCLVLASEAEAHALVVGEAMAAGLSVVVTPQAASNLDTGLPWVSVVPDLDSSMAEAVRRACQDNASHRREIRRYAESHLDWANIVRQYVDIVTSFLERA